MMLYNNMTNDYDDEFEDEYHNMKFDYNSLDHDLSKQEFKSEFDAGLDGLVIGSIDEAKLPIKMEGFDTMNNIPDNLLRMAHSQDNINMNLRVSSTLPEERMAYDDMYVNSRMAYDDSRISQSHDELNHVNYNYNNTSNNYINYDSYIPNNTTNPYQNYPMMYSNNFDLNYSHTQEFDLNVANQMSLPGNMISNIPTMAIPTQQVLHQQIASPVQPQPQVQVLQQQQQVAVAQPPAYNPDYTDYLAKFKRYKIIRGISAGGCNSRPPKLLNSNSKYYLTELQINGANLKDICYPYWSKYEKVDKRRIVRIERLQQGAKLIVNFLIVGSAHENPIMVPSTPGIDVVEVSCLECQINDYDSSDDESKSPSANDNCQYYITSVEVIEIVELLIGNQSKDPIERRKERGRVRSNLVPFWLKKPISSRMSDSPKLVSNHDYKLELAKRIMGYEIRKPRGFDKEVRILRWDKLVPALKRALQSYYTEIPENE